MKELGNGEKREVGRGPMSRPLRAAAPLLKAQRGPLLELS